MATPIKSTPVIYGKDAKAFYERIQNPKPISREEKERILNNPLFKHFEEKEVEKMLIKMMKENSPRLIMFFLIQLGKMGIDANAETMNFSQESDIKGNRYKITTSVKIKKLNRVMNDERSIANGLNSNSSAE